MSRVIRGSGEPPGGVVPKEVYDARDEARRIVEEAEAEAGRLVGDAEREAGELREAARREGLEAGRAEVAALLTRAAALRDRSLEDAERETAELALAVARRVIGEELRIAPDHVRSIVREVLGRARRAREVVVTVHPEDAETLRSMQAEADGARFEVREDPSLTRGGCVVRTDLGELDARVEVQLDALARALGARGGGLGG